MNARLSVPLRVAAVTAMASVVGVMASLPATAESSAPTPGAMQVVNTETVQVYTDAVGAIETQRIYEQLALRGKGTVEVRNPVDTDGLRNLDGFGGFDVQDGQQVARLTVDGEKRLRTVSDYNGKLPLDVKVEYFLDGTQVEPGDVVGESGKLEVRYTVKNVTAAPQELTFDDGTGGTVTRTVDVPIPMVGSLTTVAPPSFTNVSSGEANMAGDGKGGTKMSFTMTLFPPIGSDTAEFGYTADITDGVIPRASISALPVNPLESPSFKAAGESYKGGAETGAQLADGATQIDENLLKLRDGAGQLLAGLIKLRDGADKLDAGLSGVAAPGAARLADGAGELRDGVGKIDEGAGKLSDGAGQLGAGATRLGLGAHQLADGAGQVADGGRRLAGGTKQLAVGTKKLDNGAKRLDAGAKKLSVGAGQLAAGLNEAGGKAPALIDGLKQVQDGLLQVDGGLTTLHDKVGKGGDDLIAGIHQLQGGISAQLIPGVKQLYAGIDGKMVPALDQVLAGIPDSYAQLGCAQAITGDLAGGPAAPDACFPTLGGSNPGLATITGLEGAVLGSLSTQLGQGRDKLSDGTPEATDQTMQGAIMAVRGGLNSQVLPGLVVIACGVDNSSYAVCDAAKPGLIQGLGALELGVGQLVSGVQGGVGAEDDTPRDKTLRGGVNGLQQGVSQIQLGGETLLEGLAKLSDGAGQLDTGALALAAGTGELSTGTGQLNFGAQELNTGAGRLSAGADKLAAGTGRLAKGSDDLTDGAGRLADGAGRLADGTGRAADGSSQVADGAKRLSDGLGDAADGSGRIADGLRKAAGGAPKLRNGAQRLSDEGTSKLVEAGRSTAQNYGEMYAVIEAGAERAQAEKMVYGAPKGAIGLAAYSYEIKGEDGEGGRNMTRGLGGIAVLAAGAGAFALRRRLV